MRFATLAAAAALVIAPFAVAAAPNAGAQAGDAKIRVAHFSPDAPSIDVYVDGKKKLTNVPYQAVSDYLALPAGNHTFDIRAAGSPATGAAVVTASQSLVASKNYTVAAIGALSAISGKVFEDDVTPPAAGKSKVRLIHAATDVPEVDVAVKGGQTIVSKLGLGQASAYSELAAGSYDLEIRGTGTTNVLLAKPVTLQAGGVYTIAAVGGGDKAPTLRGFVDLAPSATAAVTTVPAATTAAAAASTALETSTLPPAAATTIAAATATTAKPSATTTAKANTTIAAAGASTKPAATTPAKPTTTVGKPTTTVAKPTTTEAKPTTTEAVADTTEATSDTTEATTDTEPSDTTEITSDTEAETTTTKLPVGSVGTGAGGLPGGGLLVPVLMLLLVTAGAVGTGALRRRSAH